MLPNAVAVSPSNGATIPETDVCEVTDNISIPGVEMHLRQLWRLVDAVGKTEPRRQEIRREVRRRGRI